MGEVVLGRAPDPRDVPPHARLLGGRRAPMHFLDERAVGMGDDQPHVGIAAQQRPHRGRRELGHEVMRVPLARVLQPHRHQ